MIAAALIAWTLVFTPPAFDAVRCDSIAGPCTDLRDYLLSRHGPSAFYMANRDSMLDNRTPFFTAHWPTVRAQAAWQGVGRYLSSPIVTADSCAACSYGITARDSTGNESCMSNEVAHPP